MGYRKIDRAEGTSFEVEPEPVPSTPWWLLALVFAFPAFLSLVAGLWFMLFLLLAVMWGIAWWLKNSKKAKKYRSPSSFTVSTDLISAKGETFRAADIHDVSIANHVGKSLDEEGEVIVMPGGSTQGYLGALTRRYFLQKLADVAYRVDVEAGGRAHTLAGGLTLVGAKGLRADILRVLNLRS